MMSFLIYLNISRPASSIIEAASMGASQSVGIVGEITAHLIGFVAILALVNNSLIWLGERIGLEEFSFEVFKIILNTLIFMMLI